MVRVALEMVPTSVDMLGNDALNTAKQSRCNKSEQSLSCLGSRSLDVI